MANHPEPIRVAIIEAAGQIAATMGAKANDPASALREALNGFQTALDTISKRVSEILPDTEDEKPKRP